MMPVVELVSGMPRVIFVRVGGTDDDPRFGLLDADDVKAVNGQNTIVADVKGERAKRTALQNKAIHKYWSIICDKLNSSGWTKKKYYEAKEVDIEWTPESVGEDIWRGIQEAMYQHRRTSKLEPGHVTKVFEVMDRHLSNTCGSEISAPFPSKDSLFDKQMGRK